MGPAPSLSAACGQGVAAAYTCRHCSIAKTYRHCLVAVKRRNLLSVSATYLPQTVSLQSGSRAVEMPPDSRKAGPVAGSEDVSLASVEQQLLGLQKLCRSLKLKNPRIEGLDPIARRLEKEVCSLPLTEALVITHSSMVAPGTDTFSNSVLVVRMPIKCCGPPHFHLQTLQLTESIFHTRYGRGRVHFRWAACHYYCGGLCRWTSCSSAATSQPPGMTRASPVAHHPQSFTCPCSFRCTSRGACPKCHYQCRFILFCSPSTHRLRAKSVSNFV